jgi:hypothetical protein
LKHNGDAADAEGRPNREDNPTAPMVREQPGGPITRCAVFVATAKPKENETDRPRGKAEMK